MFKYIAGNSINSALRCSAKSIRNNKIPIINYAIEETSDKYRVFDEHKSLIEKLNSGSKVAIKLSSFQFDKKLINHLLELSTEKSVQMIIDAEKGLDYYKYQNISNEIVFTHNVDKCNVVKTYQMYRKDSLETLIHDLEFFKQNDIYFGTKLVRGAYWNSENEEGFLFQEKNQTDTSYNYALLHLADNHHSKIYNILATHNTESIHLGGLLNDYYANTIFDFAHLLGMKEKKYNNYIKKGENVHVYIPYGPYREMIPYLGRRLFENLDTLRYIF